MYMYAYAGCAKFVLFVSILLKVQVTKFSSEMATAYHKSFQHWIYPSCGGPINHNHVLSVYKQNCTSTSQFSRLLQKT